MLFNRFIISVFTFLSFTLAIGDPSLADEGKFITLASTTSTQNSGLYEFLLPKFTQETGINVRVVAVGTGQALRMARHGDADVLLVHDTASEEKFVADGFGVDRRNVMYNDFVIVGPGNNPAGIADPHDALAAMAAIAKAKIPFVSRGDDSGTNKAELRLWAAADIDPRPFSGSWYRETGVGMGECLNIASAMEAYTLSDRGTWLSFNNRANLEISVEGDPRLFNQYGIILVNPKRFTHIKADLGNTFINWMTSAQGQATISQFRIKGQQLFFPNANKN